MSHFVIDESVLKNMNKKKAHSVVSTAIPISYLVEGYQKMAKDFPTMADLKDVGIFFVKNYKVNIDQGKTYNFKDEQGVDIQLMVAPISTVFKLVSKDEKINCFVKIDNEKMKIAFDDMLLKDEPLLKDSMSEKEQKALNWLLTGKVGISSRTMCNKLFPSLPMSSDSRDVPYDNSDFIRCMGFIEAIGGLTKEDWSKVASINHKWKNLVDKWEDIEKNVASENDEERREAYNLIKECINSPKPKKASL